MFPVPRFPRGIGLVLIRRCGKNLAVAGCGFLGYFLQFRSAIFGLVLRYYLGWKLKENLATLTEIKADFYKTDLKLQT